MRTTEAPATRASSGQTAISLGLPQVDDMSLLGVCRDCGGRCCRGRTLVVAEERERIIDRSGLDGFVYWAEDIFYLERGQCPYLKNGRCSVQAVKPFVCQIFPFVPRVVEGEYWLYCVGECDAAKRLPEGFAEEARRFAQAFFAKRRPSRYECYWVENKVGDFDDTRVVMKIKVFE